MSTPPENPSSGDPDFDDIDALRSDTRRENTESAKLSRIEREHRKLKNDANRDSQEFRDSIDSQMPPTLSDVEADAREDLEQQERLDVLDGLRSLQTGDPIRWRIYRDGCQDADLNGYLATWSTSQLTQERLRDEFGGGTYRIRGQFSNGRYAGGRTVHIAGDAKRKEKTEMSSSAVGFNLSEFLTQQEQRDAARRKDEETRRDRERRESEEREDKRRRERNEMLAIVMPAVTGLTTAIVGAFSANRGPDITALIAAMKGPDPITLLTQMKALQGSGNDGVLTKVLPMLIDMAGERASGGDTGWLDVIKEFAKSAGPMVGGLIQSAVTQAEQARAMGASGQPTMTVTPMSSGPNSSSVLPAPATPPIIVVPESSRRERRHRTVAEAPLVESRAMNGAMDASIAAIADSNISRHPSSEKNDMNLMALLPHLPWLRDQLARMGTAAVRNKDPDVYAALFLEELPEGIDPQVVSQLLSRSDWYQQLCQVEPRLNREDLLPWFTKMREYLLNYIMPESTNSDRTADVSRQGKPAISPTPAPRREPSSDEIQRPTKLPSLTGD